MVPSIIVFIILLLSESVGGACHPGIHGDSHTGSPLQ